MNPLTLFFKAGPWSIGGTLLFLVALPACLLGFGYDNFLSSSNFGPWLFLGQAAPALVAAVYYALVLGDRRSHGPGSDRTVWILSLVVVCVVVGVCAGLGGSLGEDRWILLVPPVAFFVATVFFAPPGCKYAGLLAYAARGPSNKDTR